MKNVNAVCCYQCESVIESKARYDFVTCMCGQVSVDGGSESPKRVFTGDGPGWYEFRSREELEAATRGIGWTRTGVDQESG